MAVARCSATRNTPATSAGHTAGVGVPRIGITSEPQHHDGRWLESTHRDHVDGVVAAGGVPVVLPVLDPALVPATLEGLDGLLVTGGGDIEPSRYRQPRMPEVDGVDPDRDDFELAAGAGGPRARPPDPRRRPGPPAGERGPRRHPRAARPGAHDGRARSVRRPRRGGARGAPGHRLAARRRRGLHHPRGQLRPPPGRRAHGCRPPGRGPLRRRPDRRRSRAWAT